MTFFLMVLVVATSVREIPETATAIFPSGAEFILEIAASDEDRSRGYMFREKIGAREGMLFLFNEPKLHGFWMKNCKVALDIIWLDAQLRVAHIAADRQPCPADGECPNAVPLKPGKYVLEVAGGTAATHGLNVGDRLVILSEPALP